jgi:hypothetical protein
MSILGELLKNKMKKGGSTTVDALICFDMVDITQKPYVEKTIYFLGGSDEQKDDMYDDIDEEELEFIRLVSSTVKSSSQTGKIHSTELYCTELCCTELCCAVLCCAVLCCAV